MFIFVKMKWLNLVFLLLAFLIFLFILTTLFRGLNVWLEYVVQNDV